MKKLFTILAGLLLTASVFGQSTSDPIPGVDIIVKKRPNNTIIRAEQSGNGRWKANIENGDYEVSLKNVKVNKAKITIDITTENGTTTLLPFILNIEGIKNGIEFKMPKKGKVAVAIFDRWGN